MFVRNLWRLLRAPDRPDPKRVSALSDTVQEIDKLLCEQRELRHINRDSSGGSTEYLELQRTPQERRVVVSECGEEFSGTAPVLGLVGP